jgi:hypothetical protein
VDATSPVEPLEPLIVGTTRVVIGAVEYAYAEVQKAVAPTRDPRAFGPVAYVAIGAVVSAEEAGISIADRVSRALAGPVGAFSRTRVASPLVRFVRNLETRGQQEAAIGDAEAVRIFSGLVERIGDSATVRVVVFNVVDEVIWPIVDKILPGVLERLSNDPEPIQALVMSQTTGIAGEFAGVARETAARADDRISSVIDRVLRRARQTNGSTPEPEVGFQ